MSTILSIDTSTSQTSVALVKDGKVLFNKNHNDPLAHGEVLPKLVAQAVEVSRDIDLVAVGMDRVHLLALELVFPLHKVLRKHLELIGLEFAH